VSVDAVDDGIVAGLGEAAEFVLVWIHDGVEFEGGVEGVDDMGEDLDGFCLSEFFCHGGQGRGATRSGSGATEACGARLWMGLLSEWHCSASFGKAQVPGPCWDRSAEADRSSTWAVSFRGLVLA